MLFMYMQHPRVFRLTRNNLPVRREAFNLVKKFASRTCDRILICKLSQMLFLHLNTASCFPLSLERSCPLVIKLRDRLDNDRDIWRRSIIELMEYVGGSSNVFHLRERYTWTTKLCCDAICPLESRSAKIACDIFHMMIISLLTFKTPEVKPELKLNSLSQ